MDGWRRRSEVEQLAKLRFRNERIGNEKDRLSCQTGRLCPENDLVSHRNLMFWISGVEFLESPVVSNRFSWFHPMHEEI